MIRPRHNLQSGFMALVSAVIISLLLITITVLLNFSVFYGRFNVLDTERKEMSVALAESCADSALLKLAANPDYTVSAAGETIWFGSNSCKIAYISSAWPKTVETIASSSEAFTNLKVVVSGPASIDVTSWEECRSFDLSHNCL